MKGHSARILQLIPLAMIFLLCDREAVNLMAQRAQPKPIRFAEESRQDENRR
jgi:hypothetical protein